VAIYTMNLYAVLGAKAVPVPCFMCGVVVQWSTELAK